jgi:membrane protease YdiL (CAAX protease family)
MAITAQEGRRAGLRSLLSRVVRWRVAPIWFVVALLGPIALQLLALALHVILGGQPPDLLAMIGMLPTVLVTSVYMLIQVGIGEEIGWRGYALPKLQTGYSALVSSVILGVLWALWHLPLFFNPATSYSNTPFWVFFVFLLPFPIVYTWIFNSTGGSVLLAMILHAVGNASIGPLWGATPEYSTAVGNTNVYLLQAAVLWVAAIVLVLVYGPRNLSRHPRQVLVAASSESQPRVQ